MVKDKLVEVKEDTLFFSVKDKSNPNQKGGDTFIPPPVVPTIIKTKTSPHTPFITNKAKEAYAKKDATRPNEGSKPGSKHNYHYSRH